MEQHYQNKEEVIENLMNWMDPSAIADVVVEQMEGEGIEVTLDNAKKVWLDALENIWETVRSSCRHANLG